MLWRDRETMMRRLPAKYAKPGMLLSRSVYDSYGYLVLEAGTALSEDAHRILAVHGVREILVEDNRLADVVIQPLVAPTLEGQAAIALRQLLTESQGASSLDTVLLQEVAMQAYAMARELFRNVLGEANTAGCFSEDELVYVRPAKVAEMSVLMGMKVGYGLLSMGGLALGALLMDVGDVQLPSRASVAVALGADDKEPQEARRHPGLGAALLSQNHSVGPDVLNAVLQHHERWGGNGYPHGLRGEDICLSARIIALADAYFNLVSDLPARKAFAPYEAVEFLMAYSGELFDPDLVQLFARQVPLYPTGVAVQLNTGEVGVVSDCSQGHIARPMVRILYDKALQELDTPYDLDLTTQEYQNRIIVRTLDR